MWAIPKIYMCGWNFNTYKGEILSTKGVIRLFENGDIDNSFNSGNLGFLTNETINCIIEHTDGKILICGAFTEYNGNTNLKYLIRLNNDGSVDSTFNSGGTGFDESVLYVNLLNNGKYLITGGNFTTYNSVSVKKIFMLNYDGTIDSTFDSAISDITTPTVNTHIHIHQFSDNSFLMNDGINATIYKIKMDGTIDINFNVSGVLANGGFTDYLILEDNSVILLGVFQIEGVFANDATSIYTNMIKLLSNGTFDSTFAIYDDYGDPKNMFTSNIIRINNNIFTTYASGVNSQELSLVPFLRKWDMNGALINNFNNLKIIDPAYIFFQRISNGSGIFDINKMIIDSNNNILICGFIVENETQAHSGLIKIDINGNILSISSNVP